MAAEPTIWILSRGRKGDLDQMLALAKATGWPFEVKALRFAGPEIPVLSNLLLTEKLSPPWPDLVLCAEASPSVIARHIKRASGGRTRIVCLGRPAGAPGNFDLVITLAPEAHHKALDMTRTMAMDVEYWPTVDPQLAQGSRDQILDAYRQVRDGLMRRIKERLAWSPKAHD